MNVGSLFSGIGGLDCGLARAGFEHAFLCESDPYRRDVLRARFPGVPVYEDVRTLGKPAGGTLADGRGASVELGRWEAGAGLLCGGFPCQDLSVAGKRAGLTGDRSGLFFEFARIAESLQPRFLLIENVPGLLSSQGGRDFGTVLGTLADLGYGLAWRILDSRYFGVPQRRRRVFILGTLAGGDPRAAAERSGEILAVGSRCSGHSQTRGEVGSDSTGALTGRSPSRLDDACAGGGQLVPEQHYYIEDFENGTLTSSEGRIDRHPLLAAPLSHGSNPDSNAAGRRREDDENLVAFALRRDPGGTGQGHNTNYVSEAASVRRLMPVECERLQALPDDWTDLGGTADSKRYAALGDAVTASVGEWIGAQLLQRIQSERAA